MKALAPALAALLLAGCLAAPGQPETASLTPPAAPDAAPLEPVAFTNLSATLLALPVVGGEARMPFEVPPGAAWAALALKWRTRTTPLALQVLDPRGQPRGEARPLDPAGPPPARRLDWWAAQPAAGTWTAVVRGQAALQEPLALQAHTLPRTVAPMHTAEALALREGTFAEVNMDMIAGQEFRYAWSAGEPVYFNIHTHRDGETINLLEDNVPGGEGNFTADADGIFSLLWELPGAGPVATGDRSTDLVYRVDGNFELHSIYG